MNRRRGRKYCLQAIQVYETTPTAYSHGTKERAAPTVNAACGTAGEWGCIREMFAGFTATEKGQSMSDIRQARNALRNRILEGDGRASPSERRAAFNNSGLAEPLGGLVDKVARHAHTITDEDFTAAQESGLREDQIFEIVVCAAVGQATRQYDAAIAALEAATGKE